MVPATGDGLVILTNSARGRQMIAQIGSIWSQWRGLPATNMTRLYQTVGLGSTLLVSLLLAFGLFLGAHFLREFRAQRRALALTWRGIYASLFELAVACAVCGTWIGLHEDIRTLPTLNKVGSVIILLFVCVVFARLVMPLKTKLKRAASAAGARTQGAAASPPLSRLGTSPRRY
jgi:quinol-cytochrome oxidoreductase complex cytochrome b subunit